MKKQKTKKSIYVSDELHQKIKIMAAMSECTMEDIVTTLVEQKGNGGK